MTGVEKRTKGQSLKLMTGFKMTSAQNIVTRLLNGLVLTLTGKKTLPELFLVNSCLNEGPAVQKKRNKFPSNRWRWPPLSQTDSRRVMHVIHVLMIGTFRSVDPLMSHYGGLVFIHHRRGRILLLFSFCAFKSRASHIFFFLLVASVSRSFSPTN